MTGGTADLADRVIAFSLSPGKDLERLGYPRSEFDRVCYELALQTVRAGGRVLYGGHFFDGGVTLDLFEHVSEAYARDPGQAGAPRKPFVSVPPWTLLGQHEFLDFHRRVLAFRNFVETRFVHTDASYFVRARYGVGPDENPDIPARVVFAPIGGGEKVTVTSDQDYRAFIAGHAPLSMPDALTLMRQAQIALAEARIVLGGKRGDPGAEGDMYQGKMPGIVEEVVASLDSQQPVAILGAFGGAARDVAIWLGLLDDADATPFLGQLNEEQMAGVARTRALVAAHRDTVATDRDDLSQFAVRDDTEALARDVVAWIARRLPTR